MIFIFLEGKLFQADAMDVREEDLVSLHSSDVCALNPDTSLMPQQHTLWGWQQTSIHRQEASSKDCPQRSLRGC